MTSESSKQNSLADTHRNSNVTDKLRLMMIVRAPLPIKDIKSLPFLCLCWNAPTDSALIIITFALLVILCGVTTFGGHCHLLNRNEKNCTAVTVNSADAVICRMSTVQVPLLAG